MNPKCHRRTVCDTFIARSAYYTGLFSMLITRAASFDHLVGAGEKHWRDFETKFLGGVEINQKREPLRLLHWQITGFCTF